MATGKVRCEKCGREFGRQGIGRHRARCNGPVEPVEKCGIDGCARAKGHAGNHYRGRKAGDAKPKRKYTRRADVLFATGAKLAAAAEIRPSTPLGASNQEPPDGIAALGHGLTRLAELLGFGGQLGDCQCPAGHLFVNTATGQAAVVTADGEIRPAEVVCG